MYAKTQALPETIKVQSDNGSLRLQFSTKYNPIFDGKRKHQGLGMKDTPENWQKAIAIAYRIEGDLQHPDWQQLFDPTFAKYGLKTKYAAELKLAAPIPEVEPEITVGAMWEDYLVWKQPQLQPTTFQILFSNTLPNAIKGLVWDKKQQQYTDNKNGVWDMPLNKNIGILLLSQSCLASGSQCKLFGALSEAFTRLQSLGKTKLTVNPFVIVGGVTENKTDKYKSTVDADGEVQEWWQVEDTETNSDERDRRAFTKDERDIIIKAFYESDKVNKQHIAPLIEFLFLTGCRSGEAFALRWRDIKFDRGYILFYKSYSTKLKNIQQTKNGVDRLFKIYAKLNDLLLRIKPADTKPTDLVFKQLNGRPCNCDSVGCNWRMAAGNYPGIVTQLVESGAISCYLSPYHTRHTFITLMAQAGADLLLLAACCGNSVEVIQRHYLGIDTTAILPDI